MKVRFVLDNSFYDCQLQITDRQGTRDFCLCVLSEDAIQFPFLDMDIAEDAFDLTVIPTMADYRSVLEEFDRTDWKDRFAQSATDLMLSAVEKMLLRVGCRYHIQGVQDGAVLHINSQEYAFGTFDRFDLLELIPMMYMFYEVSLCDHRFTLTDAFETNRNDVVRSAKKIALADILGNGFLGALFSYPIQVGRIKRLCQNKEIFKTLHAFDTMDAAERQKILDRKEQYFNS